MDATQISRNTPVSDDTHTLADMGIPKWNRFLCQVMKHLRKDRSIAKPEQYGWYIEQTQFKGRPYELPVAWFVTNGCFGDNSGSCTMCNFGSGNNISPDKLLWQLERILERVEGLPMVHITPLGSMFDDAEVPLDIRQVFFKRLVQSGCKIFGTESRAETITDEKMAQFRDAFPPSITLQVGLGVETADPYIRRNCINKGQTNEEILNAILMLKKHRIQVLLHVLLKPIFISEAEAIDDAARSINWAFENGADRIVFCMTNLKPHTLTWWLNQRNHYRVPYLWSGLSVLRAMKREQQRLCTISGLYSGVSIYQMAYNCEYCTNRVIAGLQRFSNTSDVSILNELNSNSCSCRHKWKVLVQQEIEDLPFRLPKEYEYIACEIFGRDWWQSVQEKVLRDLQRSGLLWEAYSHVPQVSKGISS